MYEGIIEALLRLFAINTNFHDKVLTESSYSLVDSYLKENFNRELVEKYQGLYQQYINYYHLERREIFYEEKGAGKKAINEEYILKICKDIVVQFDLHTRIMMIVQLLNFIHKKEGIDPADLQTLHIVSNGLKIKPREYENLLNFGIHTISKVKDKSCLFVVDGNESYKDKEIKHLHREKMQVELDLIRISSTNTLIFKYCGPRNLYLNGHRLAQRRLYVFPQGGILKTSRITPIYYSSVMTRFIQRTGKPLIVFNAENIEYKFSKKSYGLHPLSFQERSGDLVGIIGGSGTGKTTLLNVLNGKLKPDNGTITINGYDLHEPQNEDLLKGVIGYVPQDDLLLEELTVYKNLEYNARFCFGDLSDEQIKDKIEQTLTDFDLVEARDLVVGNPLKKILSGGQRKRLNIALELMREPSILFVDEPTSGLSSADSEKVMHLFKRQCLKGKLVFANIHQPASDLYKMFDRIIVMDKGGRVIFFGNPMDAITYFKNQANYINPDESECLTCGNVKTEQPLRIIEARMVDPFGKIIRKRKFSPRDWYQNYKEKIEPNVIDFMKKNPMKKEKLPDVNFKIPDWLKQLKLFLKRDFDSKKSNKQYLGIALLEAPLLAIILGFFSKYSEDGQYLLSHNDNIPAYLFMSVVVALFIGLSISAEEIFKDRKILKREEFLDLSRGAYLTSKILMLFLISAIQMLTFVIIGHYMLEIPDLTFSTWAILFTTACFANALGLNLSAGLNTAVTIYIMIPFLLVPQLLLSGVIVDFNKMHHSLSSYTKTPIIGDIMTSRWSYEALAVNMVKNNGYRETIFDAEVEKNDLSFKTFYLIPEINKYLYSYNAFVEKGNLEDAQTLIHLLNNSYNDLFQDMKSAPDSVKSALAHVGQDAYEWKDTKILSDYLDLAKTHYQEEYKAISSELEKKHNSLVKRFDTQDELIHFRDIHTNKKLEVIVRDKYSMHKTFVAENRIYQGDEPIFRKPALNNGRAHFYAPFKKIGSLEIGTVTFNIIFIWFMTFLLMLALYFDLLRKALKFVEDWRMQRQEEIRDKLLSHHSISPHKSKPNKQ